MTLRLLVVVVLGAGCLIVTWHYRRPTAAPDGAARLPMTLVSGTERTWVLFTTPWCATCGPAEERLRAADPGARVVRVDATVEPALARSMRVRRSPTAVLAGPDGVVLDRLVGPEAFAEWASARA